MAGIDGFYYDPEWVAQFPTRDLILFEDAIQVAAFCVSKGLEYKGMEADDNMHYAFIAFGRAVMNHAESDVIPSRWRLQALKHPSVTPTPQVRRMLQDASFAVGTMLGIIRSEEDQPIISDRSLYDAQPRTTN